MKKFMLWTLGVLGVICVLGLIGDATSTPEQRAARDAEWNARSYVQARLRDPSSASFSNLVTYQKGKVVCGYVNAKNGFGAYTGPVPFVWMNGAASNVLKAPTYHGAVIFSSEWGMARLAAEVVAEQCHNTATTYRPAAPAKTSKTPKSSKTSDLPWRP